LEALSILTAVVCFSTILVLLAIAVTKHHKKQHKKTHNPAVKKLLAVTLGSLVVFFAINIAREFLPRSYFQQIFSDNTTIISTGPRFLVNSVKREQPVSSSTPIVNQSSLVEALPIFSNNEKVHVVKEDVSCIQPQVGGKIYTGKYYIERDGFRYYFDNQKLQFSENTVFDKKLYALNLSSNPDLSFYAYYQSSGCNFSQLKVLKYTKDKGFNMKPLNFLFLDGTRSVQVNDAGSLQGQQVNAGGTFYTNWYSNADGKNHKEVWKYEENTNNIKELEQSSTFQ